MPGSPVTADIAAYLGPQMAALPLAYGFTLVAAVQILLALSGMWLWLRELGVSTTSSLLGAISFGFSIDSPPTLLERWKSSSADSQRASFSAQPASKASEMRLVRSVRHNRERA